MTFKNSYIMIRLQISTEENMGKYIENNLSRNEKIVQKAKLSFFGGILIMFEELAVTNKNIVGKTGIIRKRTMSSPLDKVQNVAVSKGFFGSILGYGKVKIDSAAGSYSFKYIKKPEAFKNAVLNQIDVFEQEKTKRQAAEMAAAMAGAMKH